MRLDALACFGQLIEGRDHLEVYRKLLKDADSKIRGLALKKIAEDAADAAIQSFPAKIEALLVDPNMDVKRAALKILAKRKQQATK